MVEASASAPVPGSNGGQNNQQGQGGQNGGQNNQQGQGGMAVAKPVRFISKFKRYKIHVGHTTEEYGDQKYHRLNTVQFTDLTFQTDDPAVIKKIRGSKGYRKEGDSRPAGECWEMREGENIRNAMSRLGIKDNGEPVVINGPVDTTKSQLAK